MPNASRRSVRAVARERNAAARRRSRNRAAVKQKLRTLSLAIFVAALGGGLAFDGASYFTSPAGGTLDAIAELADHEFETIAPQSEEQLRARWEQLDELQWELHRNIATELVVSPIIPALAVGSSAAETVAKETPEIVPESAQLELREEADAAFKAAREASEAEIAEARNAIFLADSDFDF